MKKKLKKAGLMLLIAAMLAQSVGSYTYAAEPAVITAEQSEKSAEAEKAKNTGTPEGLKTSEDSGSSQKEVKLPDSQENTGAIQQQTESGKTTAEIPVTTETEANGAEGDTYTLNMEDLEEQGIMIIPDKESYSEGELVSFTIENTSGKEIDCVTAALADGTEIELTEADGTYAFTMPAGEVFISVTLKLLTVNIDAELTNATAVFDKEGYLEGDIVTVTITPAEGYVIDGKSISILSGGAEVSFEAEKSDKALVVSFVLGNQDVELKATAKKLHQISFTYTDLAGADCSALFETYVSTENLTEGEEVAVSVAYKGSLGWAALVTGTSGNVSFESGSDFVKFYMPDEDVTVTFQEIEDYETGNLDDGDTELGDDLGDGSDVTTQKEYEPDVTLGKTARWDDIEKGTATLTLTEKDVSDMADAPSDYIIVLDRTASMTVDYMSVAGYAPRDENGIQSSVCLNPNHRYALNGRRVYPVDYQRGYYLDTGETFNLGYDTDLWNHHYDSSGKRIAPRAYNGCTDRLMIAQDAIKQIMDVLQNQNDTLLRGGEKNRVMYWSFAGPCPTSADGLWNEVPEFTEDIAAAKRAIQYECSGGTFYYNSFKKILNKLQEKKKDADRKDIPTKVIFISDGCPYDSNSAKAKILQMSKEIRAMEDTELYTILIGDTAGSDAGKLLKSYVKDGNFATITNNWSNFLATITKIQQKKFSIDAVEKVLTDKINTQYWEVVGEPVLESGNGTASLSSDGSVLTWNIPAGAEKTYTCKLKLKLKDEYRYLLSDTRYPTNMDDEGVTDEIIKNDPDKAGAVIRYTIKGGKYNTEKRSVGIKSPTLKYGTVNFKGVKNWTVDGSSAGSIKLQLKRIMPGSSVTTEVNNTTTNVSKNWKYSFTVRQLPDGTTRPLIKYNNAGQQITYEVDEEVPEYYTQLGSVKSEADGVVDTRLYNEPYKVKAQITKIDEETKNPLSGAEFSVYMWSALKKTYVPYKGTTAAESKPHETGTMNGADEIVRLEEGAKGVYTTPVWLYYSPDNQGKFRIIETKAPEGYFGDWKDDDIITSDEDKNVYDLVISSDPSKNGETIIICNSEAEKFGNQRVKGEISFSKLDLEVKTGKAQGDATLSEAFYELHAAENIVHQDGTTGILYHKGDLIPVSAGGYEEGVWVYEYDPDGTARMRTGLSGEVKITNLELGKYYLKETEASEGYLVDPNIYEVDVAYENEKVEVVKKDTDVFERVMKQSLSFYKYTTDNNSDKLDPMKGAGFSVYLVSELENGKYDALSDEELVQAVIDDMRNPSTLQYDTYEKYAPATVYAEEDSEDVTSGRLVKTVNYADGKTYKASNDNENEFLVSELESDKNGVVKTPGLPYGRYIVIETKTPKGKTATRPFVINVISDEKDGTVDGDGKGTPLQDMQLTVLLDRPIMSLIRIMKRDAQSKNIVLKEGAAYIIHDVDGAWFDYITNEMTTAQKKAYKETYGDLVAQYSQGTYYGTKEDPFVTKLVKADDDETANVYIETPMQLPSGTYELEELGAPDGYILQGHEGVIAKKAALSGNRTFYETEEDGAWTETPKGRTRFIVSNNESVYDEAAMSFITTVRQDNEPAVGKISVYAEGEKLVSAEQIGTTMIDRLADKLESFFGYLGGIFGLDTPAEDDLTEAELASYQDYEFEYEARPIEGAQFEIRAAEDIYSPEGGANATLLFSKGELVVSLTTDENGQAWTGKEDWDGTDIAKGLPLGTYTVTQTAAGYGFALSEENAVPREVEIAYAGQTVPVIYKDTAYENPRQKVNIGVAKTDKETGMPLSGATFGLYAEEDIRNDKGKVVVKAGTLVATASTYASGDEGVADAVFEPDLPLAKYYIREIRAPYGYAAYKEKIAVDASYQEDQREAIEVSEIVENVQTKTQINLMDYYTEVELDGAQLTVIDEEGNSFITILSVHDGNPVIQGLEINKTYTVKELVSPEGYHYHFYIKDGYVTSKEDAVELNKKYAAEDGNVTDSVQFTVQDTEKLQAVSVFNKPITGELTIEKKGEVAVSTEKTTDANGNVIETPVYEIKGLPGAEYALRAREDIVYPDGYTGTIFSAGDIVLDQYAKLKDTGLLKNYKIDVSEGCGELLDVSGYLGIRYDENSTEQEILDFYKEHGNEVERQIPSEEEIETGKTLYNGTPVKYTLKTNEDGIIKLSGLPLGQYEAVEVKAPEGYVRDKSECIHTVSVTVPEDLSERPEEVLKVSTVFENAKQEAAPEPVPGQIIYHPDIEVTKTADKILYHPGEIVVYSITVKNTGDVDLKNVTVKDSLAGGIIRNIEYLKVGEAETFDYQYVIPADTAAGSRIDNVVIASGTPVIPDPGMDEDGDPIIVDPSSYEPPSDSDKEKVFVEEKGIVVKKTARNKIYHPGETAVYDIEVINPNGYDLVDVKVEDSLSGIFQIEMESNNIHKLDDGTVLIDILPAYEKVSLIYVFEIPENAKEGEIENIVNVVGKPKKNPENPEIPEEPVTDTDKEEIIVEKEHAGLTVTKYSIDEGVRTPKAGAEFTLYAKEDVKNIFGTVIYAAGTEIETAVSGADGVARFVTDVPIGIYKVLETKAPAGHCGSDKEIIFDLMQWKNDDSVHYLSLHDFVENRIIKVEITKIDKELGIPITGAKLELRDKEGNVIAAWISSESESFCIKGISAGIYTIVETGRPEGYLQMQPMKITVKETPEIQGFIYENVFDPNTDRVEVEKSTIEMTQVNDTFKYSIDKIRNNVAASLENFTVTDTLPEEVRLKELCTGTYNDKGTLKVEFKTNKNTNWKLWKDNISTLKVTKLTVADLKLAEGEYITEFRLCFGEVKAQFKNLISPIYMVTAVEKGDGKLKNDISISGTKLDVTFTDNDTTITTVYEESVTGHPASPEDHEPQYEITDEPEEGRIGFGFGSANGSGAKTGDDTQILFLLAVFAVSLTGLIVVRKKKSDYQEK